MKTKKYVIEYRNLDDEAAPIHKMVVKAENLDHAWFEAEERLFHPDDPDWEILKVYKQPPPPDEGWLLQINSRTKARY